MLIKVVSVKLNFNRNLIFTLNKLTWFKNFKILIRWDIIRSPFLLKGNTIKKLENQVIQIRYI